MDYELLKQLEQLKKKDIETGEKLASEGRLYGQYAQEMRKVHRENAYALDEIVSRHGWPTLSMVGVEGTGHAWLIAQHAICTPELQRKFLRLLSKVAEKGDAPEKQVAFLIDRIRFNEGKPQVYGMVLDWNEKREFTCELEEPDKVDERRNSIGMPPFEQSRQEHENEVRAKSGKPPEDYKAYRDGMLEWAKSVGWQ